MARKSNITMAGLADLAGVSISTVSRALADNPAIAKATRTQIKSLAKEHGFAPNPLAQGLRRQRTDTIGVVVPLGHEREQHLTDPFMMTMIGHLADALSERGLDMLLRRIIPASDDWLDKLTSSGRTDGVIVLGQSDQHDIINAAANGDEPLVVWGAHLPDSRYVTVGSDNITGGMLAARHLIQQGRTKLLFLGQSDVPEFALREQGFRTEVSPNPGIAATYLRINLEPQVAHRQLHEQLAGIGAIDGVFAVSDVIALAAVDVLERSGLAVPQDVSVIGYDNVSLVGLGVKPLTTMDQHIGDAARAIVDRLIDMIDGKETSSLVIDPTLVHRSTSLDLADA